MSPRSAKRPCCPGMKPSAQALPWMTDVAALRDYGMVLTTTHELDMDATQQCHARMRIK